MTDVMNISRQPLVKNIHTCPSAVQLVCRISLDESEAYGHM